MNTRVAWLCSASLFALLMALVLWGEWIVKGLV